MTSRRVCYVLSHGFSARMVLHSGLVGELRDRGIELVVLAPSADEAEMTEHAAQAGYRVALCPEVGRAASVVSDRASRYVFEDVRGNAALRARHLRETESSAVWQRWLAHACMGLHHVAHRTPALKRGVAFAQQRLLRNPRMARAIAAIDPDLVVSTYPVALAEASALLEAQSMGVPTAIHLLSWDNITCKGRFVALADQYLTWGPVMSSELRTQYSVSSSRIHECGVPHFDAHVHAGRRSAAPDLSTLGLQTDAPYLFFGMSSPVFAPREIDIVEQLATDVRANRFGEQVQLVVRPHPQNVRGYMADASWLPRLSALIGERVGVDIPQLADSSLPWSLEQQDLAHLARLVGGASVVINSGSTLAIDALMHDRPVVLTNYDGPEQGRAWHDSARRLVEYPHLARLLSFGGVESVHSRGALNRALSAALADPERLRDARARTLAAQCGPRDGRACARVADALAEICRTGATLDSQIA